MTLELLINSCRILDRPAQNLFFEQFKGYVMTVCRQYTSSDEEAKDLFQETFVKVFANLDTLKNPSSVKSWMRAIAVRLCLNYYKKNRKFEFAVDLEETNDKVSEDSADAIIGEMSAEEILEMIRLLPKSHQLVFNLFVIEGYSHKEIADKLDIAPSSSRVFLNAAKNKLKELLNNNHLGYSSKYS